MGNIDVIEHPIVQYWLTKLRDRQTSSPEFRKALKMISTFLGYEALRNIQVSAKTVQTPIASTIGKMIDIDIFVVPILRTGLLLTNGILSVYPDARIVPIGLRRENGIIRTYDAELPELKNRGHCIILDGIIGTGATMLQSLKITHSVWPDIDYTVISVIGLKDSVERISALYPKVKFYLAAYDLKENNEGYMVPGLGDIRRRTYNVNDIIDWEIDL